MGLKLLQRLRVRLKIGSEVSEGFQCFRAEVVLNPLDVARLCFSV